MNRFGSSRKLIRGWFSLIFLVSLTLLAAAQHNKTSSSTNSSRPAPTSHTTAPPQHAPAHQSAPTSHAPVSNSHPSNGMGTHPGTTMGGRTNTPGGPVTTGRNGTPGSMNHPTNTNHSTGPASMGNAHGSMGNAHGPIGNGNANGRMPAHAAMVNRPLPGRQVTLRGGGSAVIRPNGQIRAINRNGMQINRGVNGTRTVVSYHNGARIVTTGRNSGYVQRAYVTRGGNTYVSRTVVVNRVTYTNVYRSYSYRGYCCYYGYHPAYYYAPVYYGWAYNPWPAPVYYSWGWGPAPWYGYYGGYFAPYPAYPSAAFWLTDYLIAANLQAAYQVRAAAASAGNGDNADNGGNGGGDQQQSQPSGSDNISANSGQVTLTPEVKE